MYRSTKNGGASWNFPGRYVAITEDLAGAGTDLEDKQLLTVDNSTTSPFRDRLYVTWTHYTATTAYIYEAYSSDYGETFSAPIRVTPNGGEVHCPNSLTTSGSCDNNQFSQPFTAPDGTLYVLYSNFNTTSWNNTARAQVLMQRSTDGGKTFDVPHKVTDYYDLPDCATYQGGADPGRSCVPEKGSTTNSIFRASNYAVGAVNPDSPNRVVVSIPSYINPDSNEANGCKPTGIEPSSGGGLYTGVKTPGACANHIILSTSLNNGVTFNGASTDPRQMPMAMTPAQAHTSQWFQWMTYSNHKLAIATYDRQYGSDETNGYSDQTLLGSVNGVGWASSRVTTSSMPPPTQFSGVFWGDYSGLAAAGDTAWPLWSDTRVPDIFLCPGSGTTGNPPKLCGLQDANGTANDEDIFVQALPIPAGGA
jgi:hypothetical protein